MPGLVPIDMEGRLWTVLDPASGKYARPCRR
jgi:hypothetical protein